MIFFHWHRLSFGFIWHRLPFGFISTAANFTARLLHPTTNQQLVVRLLQASGKLSATCIVLEPSIIEYSLGSLMDGFTFHKMIWAFLTLTRLKLWNLLTYALSHVYWLVTTSRIKTLHKNWVHHYRLEHSKERNSDQGWSDPSLSM